MRWFWCFVVRTFLIGVLLGVLFWVVVLPAIAQERYTPGCAVAGEMERRPWYYTVEPGDCLWKITERAGNAGVNYSVLVAYNKKLFVDSGRSPDLIFRGEKIRVPEGWAYSLGLVNVQPKAQAPVGGQTIVSPWPGEQEKRQSPWSSIGALVVLLLAALTMALWRPWNFFRPAHVGAPVIEGGISNPLQAAEVLRTQAAESGEMPSDAVLKELRKVKIYGWIQVAGADGIFKRRCCNGNIGWEGIFESASTGREYKRYTLAACANPLRVGEGGRLLSGYVVPVEEFPVPSLVQFEPEPVSTRITPKPGTTIVSEPEVNSATEPETSMMYPFHPCVVGRTMMMLRLAAAVQGGGLRK